MNITSAQYVNKLETTEKDHIEAIIDGQQMSVPLDSDNRHYQAIQEWVAAGNKIKDAD
tara:strand:+ start:336 stop:509 length:174 start_codon:yes stop_codon:yes gene_type:complete